MKKNKMIVLAAALSLLSWQAAAYADTIQGRVANIAWKTLDMTVYDAQGRPYPNTLHLKTDSSTKYAGVSSSSALKKGDPVQTVVSQDKTGAWRADSVMKLKPTAPVQTTRPSPSLSGVLSNKVVRNGLLGAGTGAIAASASGGKAGKGALIGAGVGILGGWLADGMSQPRQQEQQADVSYQDDQRN